VAGLWRGHPAQMPPNSCGSIHDLLSLRSAVVDNEAPRVEMSVYFIEAQLARWTHCARVSHKNIGTDRGRGRGQTPHRARSHVVARFFPWEHFPYDAASESEACDITCAVAKFRAQAKKG
jgi:hypothetical protein